MNKPIRPSEDINISRNTQGDTHDLRDYRSRQVFVKEMLLGLLVIMLDQVSKMVFVSEHINTGGVFGIGKDWAWMLLSLIALVVLGWVLVKSERVVERYGLVIILASGLSNLIDRIFLGGVRDFIYWPILNVYGNMADLLLSVGVILVIFDYLKMRKNY